TLISTYVHIMVPEVSQLLVTDTTLPETISRELTINSVSDSIIAEVAFVVWENIRTKSVERKRLGIVLPDCFIHIDPFYSLKRTIVRFFCSEGEPVENALELAPEAESRWGP